MIKIQLERAIQCLDQLEEGNNIQHALITARATVAGVIRSLATTLPMPACVHLIAAYCIAGVYDMYLSGCRKIDEDYEKRCRVAGNKKRKKKNIYSYSYLADINRKFQVCSCWSQLLLALISLFFNKIESITRIIIQLIRCIT